MTDMTSDTTTTQSDRSNPMTTRATTLFDVIADLQDHVTDASDGRITETVMRLCQRGCLKWQGPFQSADSLCASRGTGLVTKGM